MRASLCLPPPPLPCPQTSPPSSPSLLLPTPLTLSSISLPPPLPPCSLVFFTYFGMMTASILPIIALAQIVNILFLNVFFLFG